LLAAAEDGNRAPEDRAAAVAALALARLPAALYGLWELIEGPDAIPVAAIEAFDDLPESVRQSLLGELSTHRDARARALAGRLSQAPAIDSSTLLEQIETSLRPGDRESACAALVRQGGVGLRMLLDSPRLLATLPQETAAWAMARGAWPNAVDLTRALPPNEATPRLLTALGGTGYAAAVPVLLDLVSDERGDLADAAGAAIAALTGIELVRSTAGEEAESEVWSRDRRQWSDAVERLSLPISGTARLVRGAPWTARRAEDALSDPKARNGVRRVLALGLGFDSASRRTTSFYWLQKRAPG
jgi:hypothetical protein